MTVETQLSPNDRLIKATYAVGDVSTAFDEVAGDPSKGISLSRLQSEIPADLIREAMRALSDWALASAELRDDQLEGRFGEVTYELLGIAMNDGPVQD